MAARALRTPTTVAVLGLLAERPRHVYDMRVTMRERGHDRVLEIKSASLYDALRRLAAAGTVEAAETIRDSARPERTVYRITETGTRQLLQWLRELLGDPAHGRTAFTGALMFMYALPHTEVADLLDGRADLLDQEIAAMDTAAQAARSHGLPPIFLSEDSYTQTLRRAECDWLRAFAGDLRTRRLTWPERTLP
ncbi:PadR family transcriptional regulator [Kitasatospora kifunensis]|uniref:DNA-binding PadR family transcriptional regulator n=1 Tax=Kitasatospora kifunensis TaxID=58351 RepID=A0A7W7RAX7_KITKI|nr:PadR family transcriptional regulator [Kitasatospora kifunensis]MBB4928642.1 DNA-binding PadR family transcriptional regulator [Kitasatospora kifunensis]